MIRLLIADDSALMRKLLGGIFGAEGDFEIEFARDGEEALEVARRFRPHVATLDVNMPVMDGLTCLGRLMVEVPCPVVMVSSLTRENAEATLEAMRLGAVDFIAKPEGTISLNIDRIRPHLVEKVRAAARARLRPTLRLAERVRHQIGRSGAAQAPDGPAPPMPPLPPMRGAVPARSRRRPESGGAIEGLVLLGASTGGPRAIEVVLSGLPGDLPWPVLVAQHIPAAFTGVFAQRLDQLCELTVVEVSRPTPLRAGHAYIGRGDADIVVARRPSGLVALSVPSSPSFRWHPSVDRLVYSALDVVEAPKLLGVLLTGMGNDGAAAMARVKAEGGRTIAEAEETAVVWGMPGDLVGRDGASIVAPLPGIVPSILKSVT